MGVVLVKRRDKCRELGEKGYWKEYYPGGCQNCRIPCDQDEAWKEENGQTAK
jgi:hypothetical protein